MKKEIKIAGAGPAGLSAAINLAKAGYKATVYEQNSDVGFKSNGDFQGLENWTKNLDILKDFRKMNIKTNFKYTPMRKFEVYDYKSNKYIFKSKKPICYIIRRGNKKDCLDYALKKQALAAGVKIIFNKKTEENKADIIATGFKETAALGEGITFETDLPNTVMVIRDEKIAPGGYAYLIAINGKACLLSCMIRGEFKKAELYFKRTLKRFQEIKKFKIKNKKREGCFISYHIRESAIKNKKLLAGEAAGFQDYLFGFGIRYAVTSGYLAAKSIIEHKNYDTLWKDEFGALHKQGLSNRLRLEYAGNKGFIAFAEKGAGQDHTAFFGQIYRPNLHKALLYPFAKALYKDRNIFK